MPRSPRCAGWRASTGCSSGPSSGANLVAARAWRDAHPEAREVVTFFCDEGEKYITDYFTPD